VLGNFFDDESTTTDVLNQAGNTQSSYVYFDDICVSYDPLDCGFITGVDDLNIRKEIEVYPNPFVDVITIKLHTPLSHLLRLELYDHLGKQCWAGQMPIHAVMKEFTIRGLPPGFYILRFVSTNHLFSPV